MIIIRVKSSISRKYGGPSFKSILLSYQIILGIENVIQSYRNYTAHLLSVFLHATPVYFLISSITDEFLPRAVWLPF